MRKYSLFVVLLFCCIFHGYAGGLSSFEERTPFGNRLYYDGTATGTVWFFFSPSASSNENDGLSFNRFYFYKNFLIAESKNTYYIIDERQRNYKRYADRLLFEEALKHHRLKPRIRTRWYDHHYDEANLKWIYFMAIIMFPLTIVIAGMYLYSIYSLAIQRSKKFKILKKTYLLTISIFMFVLFVIQTFPQSI